MLWKVITINKYLPAELKVGVLCLWLPKPGHLPAQWSSWPQLCATLASLLKMLIWMLLEKKMVA